MIIKITFGSENTWLAIIIDTPEVRAADINARVRRVSCPGPPQQVPGNESTDNEDQRRKHRSRTKQPDCPFIMEGTDHHGHQKHDRCTLLEDQFAQADLDLGQKHESTTGLRLHIDSLVLQNPDLNSPIFRAALCSCVIGDGLGVTKSKGLNQPPQIQTMHANQVLNYGLRASIAQGAIFRRIDIMGREYPPISLNQLASQENQTTSNRTNVAFRCGSRLANSSSELT